MPLLMMKCPRCTKGSVDNHGTCYACGYDHVPSMPIGLFHEGPDKTRKRKDKLENYADDDF